LGLLPDTAIGAILAALIAGVVSLLGLIISKEQKVSEFRQAWIDALRAELSVYLVNVNSISDATKLNYATVSEKLTALAPAYSLLNAATFNIVLRLNPKEGYSEKLFESMGDFSDLLEDISRLTPENIRPIEERFLERAQAVLRYEWGRVKKGELTFRIAKWSALILVSVTLAVVALLAWQLAARRPTPPPIAVSTPSEIIIMNNRDASVPAAPAGARR